MRFWLAGFVAIVLFALMVMGGVLGMVGGGLGLLALAYFYKE